MNGRDFFKKYFRVIGFLSDIIPASLLSPFLSIFDSSERKLAIFFRYLYYKKKAAQFAPNIFVGRSVVIKSPAELSVGENVSLHAFCYLDAAGGIDIGNNVSVAHSCSIISFEHTWEDPKIPIKYNKTKLAGVVIEDDVWLGCSVRVLAGAYIENRVVVAAGSVVKGRLLSGYIYGGIPAKVIGKI